jgi:hypothetical protein
MRNHNIVYENQQVNRLAEQSDFFSVNPSLLRTKFTWFCHSRGLRPGGAYAPEGSGNPVFPSIYWIPAFAGMTFVFPLSHVFRVTFRDEPKIPNRTNQTSISNSKTEKLFVILVFLLF